MTATHYTDSKGQPVEIAKMATPHLISAHKKAVATEERRHTTAHNFDETYENPEREAEIDAMKAEIDRREAISSEQQQGFEA